MSVEQKQMDIELAHNTDHYPNSQRNNDEDETQYVQGVRLLLNFTSVALATVLVGYDVNCVTTIIPVITDEFNSLNAVGWYGAAFLLASASSQLFYGKIYRFFPARFVFTGVVFIYALGNLMCALAPSSAAFTVGRAISGLGSAGVLAGTVIIISRTLPVQRRPIYMGVVGAIESLAIAVGPLLGGLIADNLGWRWCFWLCLPVAGLAILITLLFFSGGDGPEQDAMALSAKLRQLDFVSIVLFVPAIVCLILALQWGGSQYEWSSWRIILLFVVFVCLSICFAGLQWWNGDEATVPPKIVLTRTVLFGALYSFNTSGALDVAAYYLPIWFQAIKGASAFGSGVRGLPLVLALCLSVLASGSITSIIGYYTPAMFLGSIMSSVGAGLMTTFKVTTPKPIWIVVQIIYALGAGFGFQQPFIAAQTNFSAKEMPTVLVLMSFLQTIGGVVAVSSAQSVFSNQLLSNLRHLAPDTDASLVQNTGVLNLKSKFGEQQLMEILPAYNLSITRVLFVPTVMSALTIVGCIGIPWRSVKEKQHESEVRDVGLREGVRRKTSL